MSKKVYKTKEVADLFHTSTTTIHKWVKKYDLQLETNERGHYLFDEKAIDMLHKAAERREQHLYGQEHARSMVDYREVMSRLDNLVMRIEQLESLVHSKADEVVAYQILKHRQEIDEVTKKVHKVEEEISELNQEKDVPQVQEKNNKEEGRPVAGKSKGILAGLFT